MPKPSSDTLICLGVVIGAIGVQGEMRVKTFTETIKGLGDYGPLIADPGGEAFAVRSVRGVKGGAGLRLEGVDTRDAALGLKGRQLCVPRSALKGDADDDVFYHVDLIGLEVRDEAGARVGQVKDVHDFGAGDLLEIAFEDGGDEMVPFLAETVPVVDIAAGFIVVVPLEMVGDESSA